MQDSAGNCIPAVNATVYAYFNKVDSASSPSQWTSVPYTTDVNGYYTVTIEDNNFVGINAAYKRGLDEVWLAVIYGDTVLTSNSLTHASFYVHTLTTNDYNEVNLDLVKTKAPNIDSYTTLPSVLNTNTVYSLSSTSSINTLWEPGICYPSTNTSQKLTYATVPIFTGHALDRVEYDTQDTVIIKTPNTGAQFSYTTAGDRTISITVYEKWNTFSTITQKVQVKYNTPSLDFDWSPKTINDTWDTNTKLRGPEPITFSNLTTDLDNRAAQYIYEFVIYDSDLAGNPVNTNFSNLGLSDTVTYTFKSPGTKTVELLCYWNDGYVDQVTKISKTIDIFEKQVLIDSINQLTISNDRWTPVDFNLSLTGNLSDITTVLWMISDYYDPNNPDNPNLGNLEDNSVIFTTNYEDVVSHKFQAYETHLVQVEITYNTGWELKTVTSHINVNLRFHTLTPDFSISSPGQIIRNSILGKVPITYSDNTIDILGLYKTGKYIINDIDLSGNTTVVNSNMLTKTETFTYTFAFPSRAPFSATNGASNRVYNKKVTYEITYDNGWVISTTSTTKYFEAAPLEFSGTISMRCNVDGVSY